MNNFYCNDFYWAVACDNVARGLFVLEEDARALFESLDPIRQFGDVELWRLNGGHLCTPAVERKAFPE